MARVVVVIDEPGATDIVRDALPNASVVFELPDNYCLGCAEQTSFKPSHNGSTRCESGSIASGGRNAHCTCDTCF